MGSNASLSVESLLMSTDNICLHGEIRNNVLCLDLCLGYSSQINVSVLNTFWAHSADDKLIFPDIRL